MAYDQIITLDDGQRGHGDDLPDDRCTFTPLAAAPDYAFYDASCYLPADDPPASIPLTWTGTELFSGFSSLAQLATFEPTAREYSADLRTADYLVARYARPESGGGSVTRWIKRAALVDMGVLVDQWTVESKYIRAAADEINVLLPAGDDETSFNRITVAVANEASWDRGERWPPPDGPRDPDQPPLVLAEALPPLQVFADFNQPDALLGTRELELVAGFNADTVITIRYDERALEYKSIRVHNRRFSVASIADVGGRKRQMEIRVSIPERAEELA